MMAPLLEVRVNTHFGLSFVSALRGVSSRDDQECRPELTPGRWYSDLTLFVQAVSHRLSR